MRWIKTRPRSRKLDAAVFTNHPDHLDHHARWRTTLGRRSCCLARSGSKRGGSIVNIDGVWPRSGPDRRKFS